MKIYIGSYYAAALGTFSAYLAANEPKYDASLSRVFDTGRIIIDGSSSGSFMRSPQDFWALSNLVGSTLAKQLLEELGRYAAKTFYYVYEHSHCGRLYFEPTHPLDDPLCDQFKVTKTNGEVLTLTGYDQLWHFICADKVSGDASWLPSGSEVKSAIHVGTRIANGIQLTNAALRLKIDWGETTEPSNHNSIKNCDSYKALASIPNANTNETFLHGFAHELVFRCNSRITPFQSELDRAAVMLGEAGLVN